MHPYTVRLIVKLSEKKITNQVNYTHVKFVGFLKFRTYQQLWGLYHMCLDFVQKVIIVTCGVSVTCECQSLVGKFLCYSAIELTKIKSCLHKKTQVRGK